MTLAVVPTFARLVAWRGRWHCEHLARDGALRRLCPLPALRLWVDDSGVRHGYCHHARIGAQEALRLRWAPDHQAVAA